MPYSDWLEAVYALGPNDFNSYSEWYSFYSAWEDGKTPKEAFDDCHQWINEGLKE